MRMDLTGHRYAHIKKDGKDMRIGSFLTLEEAAKARKAMEIHLFGEFAPCTEGGNANEANVGNQTAGG